MSKFTSGPWQTDDERSPNAVRCAESLISPTHHFSGSEYGEICKLDDGEYINYKDPEVRVANARLIAAAPEMYETIRWIAQTLHQAHHQDQSGTFLTCPKSTCDAAAKVLAKADGLS